MDRSRIPEDVKALKEWLVKQPHLPQNIDPNLLTAFVCGTKSLEIAKRKLDAFCTLRTDYSSIFQSPYRDPLDPKFKEDDSYKIFYLPTTTKEGYRTIFICNEPRKCEMFSFNPFVIKLVMFMELGMLLWPEMPGFCVVFDWIGAPKSHLTKINLFVAAGYFKYLQEAYPIKFKRSIMFNLPTFIDVITNMLFKPFMKKKLFERILFYTEDGSVLKKHFDIENIPSDYGGKEESTSSLNDKWIQIIEERRDWFKETSMLMSDESKRLPDSSDTYGIQGTFRSLTID